MCLKEEVVECAHRVGVEGGVEERLGESFLGFLVAADGGKGEGGALCFCIEKRWVGESATGGK